MQTCNLGTHALKKAPKTIQTSSMRKDAPKIPHKKLHENRRSKRTLRKQVLQASSIGARALKNTNNNNTDFKKVEQMLRNN
jgi:hypothetical protein